MFDLGSIEALAAGMAAKHSPYPWHVRLASYRFILPISQTIPQQLADEWTEVMQEAVEVWHRGDVLMPSFLHIDDLSDDQVRRRITKWQKGYNKEFDRRASRGLWSDLGSGEKQRYVFADLPWPLQRAVVSLWNASHEDWMRENKQVHYEPDFGYYWLISEPVHDEEGTPGGVVTVKVKMFETDRLDGQPTEKAALAWEERGLPGGVWGHYIKGPLQPTPATLPLYVVRGLAALKLD